MVQLPRAGPGYEATEGGVGGRLGEDIVSCTSDAGCADFGGCKGGGVSGNGSEVREIGVD